MIFNYRSIVPYIFFLKNKVLSINFISSGGWGKMPSITFWNMRTIEAKHAAPCQSHQWCPHRYHHVHMLGPVQFHRNKSMGTK
jgi:hypothetical protein